VITAGPDLEGALRDYLQQSPDMLASPAGPRTYLAARADTVFPYVTLIRIGGGDDTSNAPMDQALVQFDVLGRVLQLGEANEVRRALRIALAKLSDAPFTSPGKGRLIGSSIRDERRFPEPAAQDPDGAVGERPRYIVTAQVLVIDAPA